MMDREGVGQLVQMRRDEGRRQRPTLKVGMCGEHGGDPTSVEFCRADWIGLRVVLAVPRTGSAPGRGPCGARQDRREPSG